MALELRLNSCEMAFSWNQTAVLLSSACRLHPALVPAFSPRLPRPPLCPSPHPSPLRRLDGVLLMAVVINSYLLSVHISPYIPLSSWLSIHLPPNHFLFTAIYPPHLHPTQSFPTPSARLSLSALPFCSSVTLPSLRSPAFFIVKRQKAQKGFLIKAGCC